MLRTVLFVALGGLANFAAFYLSFFVASLLGFRDLVLLIAFLMAVFPSISAVLVVLVARLFGAADPGGRAQSDSRIALAAMGVAAVTFAFALILILYGIATAAEALALSLLPLTLGLLLVKRLV